MSNLKAPTGKHRPVVRVLIADDEQLLAQRLATFLEEKGFLTRIAKNGPECREAVQVWQPDFVFFDLMLPELNALAFLRELSKQDRLGENKTKVFVFSGHNDPSNIRECMRLGASDYIAKPFRHADLLARLVLHMHPKRETPDAKEPATYSQGTDQYYIHLTDLTLREALKGAPSEETLHHLTGMLSLSFNAVRVSVVKCDLFGRQGQVVASSDKRDIQSLAIDLVKYPEILYVLNNDKMLALDNLAADSTMHFVTRQEKSIRFNAMIVAPVRIGTRLWGVVSVRLPEKQKHPLTDAELRYAQLVAHVMGLVVMREPKLLADSPPIATSAA